MSASFTLELDVTAPGVEWGSVLVAEPAGQIDFPYLSTEAISFASLHLRDGRLISLSPVEGRLVGVVPDDAPLGPATIYVSDQVGNTSTFTRAVLIADVVASAFDLEATKTTVLDESPYGATSSVFVSVSTTLEEFEGPADTTVSVSDILHSSVELSESLEQKDES